MKILNQTQVTVVTDNVYETKDLIERTLGLLNTTLSRSLLIRTRWGIHTFGLSTAIDVIIMDDVGHIVALAESLKPWRIYLWNTKYDRVLELPQGTIEAARARVGDLLVLE